MKKFAWIVLLYLLSSVSVHADELAVEKLLAELGSASEQYDLGLIYDRGERVPQDYAEAAGWYRMAAEQGHAEAQSKLGRMYYKGQGVPQCRFASNIEPAFACLN